MSVCHRWGLFFELYFAVVVNVSEYLLGGSKRVSLRICVREWTARNQRKSEADDCREGEWERRKSLLKQKQSSTASIVDIGDTKNRWCTAKLKKLTCPYRTHYPRWAMRTEGGWRCRRKAIQAYLKRFDLRNMRPLEPIIRTMEPISQTRRIHANRFLGVSLSLSALRNLDCFDHQLEHYCDEPLSNLHLSRESQK